MTIPYLKIKKQKIYKSRATTLDFCWTMIFSPEIGNFCYIEKYSNFDVDKIYLPGLLEIKSFWNNGYDVILSVQDVTNKILLHYSD